MRSYDAKSFQTELTLVNCHPLVLTLYTQMRGDTTFSKQCLLDKKICLYSPRERCTYSKHITKKYVVGCTGSNGTVFFRHIVRPMLNLRLFVLCVNTNEKNVGRKTFVYATRHRRCSYDYSDI